MMLKHRNHFIEIGDIFSEFPDLERLLSGLTVTPQTPSIKTAKAGIDTLIYLKTSLLLLSTRLVPALRLLITHQSESGVRSDTNTNSLVESFIANFEAGGFTALSERLDEVLTDSTAYSSSAEVMRHQECFALKAPPPRSINGTKDENDSGGGDEETTSRLQILLAIARTSFLQCVEDIYLKADTYSQQLTKAGFEEDQTPVKVKVKFSSLRGYHLIIPATALRRATGEKSKLPDVFVQPIMLANSIACTTMEISSLSDRAHEAICAALNLTHALIGDTIEEIRQNFLKDLHAFVDSVSLMDMLLSFTSLADHSTSIYCRPTLTSSSPYSSSSLKDAAPSVSSPSSDGVLLPNAQSAGNAEAGNTLGSNTASLVLLLLEKSRHPIISELSQRTAGGLGRQVFVENSVLIDSSVSQVQIVTGVNGCGKSTLIKQIALITILAQIGCLVPCVSAVLPLRDRLFSRLSNQDDLENNLSTFHVEMKEAAYILDHVTDQSLVIIDELGRGSSNVDGLALAFAVCEHFATHSSAFTLFATHFPQITQIARMYPNVQNIHLKTELYVSGRGAADRGLSSPASRIIHHYSLYLGPYNIKYGYGIMVSENMSLDSQLITDAKHFQAILQKTYPSLLGGPHGVVTESEESVASCRILKNLVKHFSLLKKSATAPSVAPSDPEDLSSCSPTAYDCRQFFSRIKIALSSHQHQHMRDILNNI